MDLGGHEVKKRSILIDGHQTSVSLEDAFWDVFKHIAKARGVSVNNLVGQIDHARTKRQAAGNLSGAIRVFVLRHLQGPEHPEA